MDGKFSKYDHLALEHSLSQDEDLKDDGKIESASDIIDQVCCNYFLRTGKLLPSISRVEKITKGPTRAVIYGYNQNCNYPIVYAKLAYGKKERHWFESESLILSELAKTKSLSETVPLVIGEYRTDHVYALVNLGREGALFKPVKPWMFLSSARVDSYLLKVYEWWKTLVICKDFDGRKVYLSTKPQQVLNSFLCSFGCDHQIHASAYLIVTKVQELFGHGIRLSLIHGDLWRENIWENGDSLYVFDWERCELVAYPLFDLFLFLSTLVDDSSQKSFAWTFFDKNWFSKQVRQILNSAYEFLGLSRTEAKDLFFYFLLTMSCQGTRYFGHRTAWDNNWYGRLKFALDNQGKLKL